MGEWWEGFFDAVWEAGGFGAAGEEAPEEQLEYLWRQLELAPGKRLADICCGIGRHSIPLARRGVVVTAVDFQQHYLDRLTERAAGLPITTVCADMRATGLPDAAFDAAVNLWTSFGYFADEAENRRALAEWSRILRPGGRLVMQLVNRDGLMKSYRSASGGVRDNGWILVEEAEFDYRRGRNHSRWTWVAPDGVRHVRELDLRIYCQQELAAMGEEVGLELIDAHGDLAGAPAGRDHTHMHLTFVRR